MGKFIKLTILYSILLFTSLILLLIYVSMTVKNRDFKNYETESNLLVMNSKKEYELLFMGISHARNFSRHKNHLRVENILDKKIFNIGQGGGACGINEQLYYLDFFFYRKNKVSTIIYVISPPLFFSETLPKASNTFDYEPFDFSFLLRYLLFASENKTERVMSYLNSKFTRSWFLYRPKSIDSKSEKLDSIDISAVTEGQNLAYGDTLSLSRFHQSTDRIKETIDLALKNGSNIILIIPPALFGKWKGHKEVENFAIKMQKIKGVRFYDFSEAVLSAKYYYDHHHINTNGIVFFTEKFLNPLINNTSGQKE